VGRDKQRYRTGERKQKEERPKRATGMEKESKGYVHGHGYKGVFDVYASQCRGVESLLILICIYVYVYVYHMYTYRYT